MPDVVLASGFRFHIVRAVVNRKVQRHHTVAAVGSREGLCIAAALVIGDAVPCVAAAGGDREGGDHRLVHPQPQRERGAAPGRGERTAANKRACCARLCLRERKPIGLVARALTHRVVDGLCHTRAHNDRLLRRVAAAIVRGARHRVGGGLRRRNVDIGLRAAGIPLVGQRRVIHHRRVAETAHGTDTARGGFSCIIKIARINTIITKINSPSIRRISFSTAPIPVVS